MNRTISSKIPKKHSLELAPLKNEEANQRKKKQGPSRNPLQDLNVVSSCSNSSCSEASSVSIEAPRGCLRFFLSNHPSSSSFYSSKPKTPIQRPKTLSKTPKSAPNLRVSKVSKSNPSKENKLSKTTIEENPERPISKKAQKFKKNPPCLYQWQSGKKSISRTAQRLKTSSVLNNIGDSEYKLQSGSEGEGLVKVVGGVGEATELKPRGGDAICTPSSKIASGSGLDCEVGEVVEETSNGSNGKTPPIQASVSPEIQCGSSVMPTITPACYAAGHIVSGVTDKRKCRPRGILTVGENEFGFGSAKSFVSFEDADDEENVVGIGNDSIVVPEPTEASMHWLLSPCDEEGEDQEDSENGSCRFRRSVGSAILHSPSSPSTGHGISSDICNNRTTTNCTDSNRRRNNSLNSPNGVQEFQGLAIMSPSHLTPSWEAITFKESKENLDDLEGEKSPFSMDAMDSGNVMQTPQSDSSSGRLIGLSWLSEYSYKKHQFESELNSAAEVLQMTSLSPERCLSIGAPVDSSFRFDCLATSSNSIDLSHFQKLLDDQASWLSSSTLDNASQSQIRISWREGLVSRIYEMDDFDCCRCLSDDEEDANGCSDNQLKSYPSPEPNVDVASNQILTNNSRSTELVDNEPRTDGKGKEQFPSHSCAESISTDGGSLVASRDSDWALCYKNHLFQE